MYLSQKSANPPMIILFVVLLSSLTVNAAEIRHFKELPKISDIKPPPRPQKFNSPSVTIGKSPRRNSRARKHTSITKEQIQKLGYRKVSNDAISYLSLDNVKSKFIPIEDIEKNISSPLSIISTKTGVYKTMDLTGTIAKSPEKETAKWTLVMRYFSLANGDILMLSEFDYQAAKISAIFPAELVNENINGSPAMLITKKTTAGKYFTTLKWFTENKLYTLHLTDRTSGTGVKNELVVLATGIQEP